MSKNGEIIYFHSLLVLEKKPLLNKKEATSKYGCHLYELKGLRMLTMKI